MLLIRHPLRLAFPVRMALIGALLLVCIGSSVNARAQGDAAQMRPIVSLPIAMLLSPNQDERPAGTVIDTIVIHDTKSPGVNDAAGIARWFARPDAEVSSHYVIGKGGEVVQCVLDEKRAWHAGPSHMDERTHVNNFSIGIELVNDETGLDAFTEAQYASLITLTADLMYRYNIPLNHIVGHRDVTDFPKERQDPADNFDWVRLFNGATETLATKEVRRAESGESVPASVGADAGS
jgi:N-acetyl-anhydromuramyl-L-alanine amidase AmpD